LGVELRCESGRGRRYIRALRRDAAALLRVTGLASCELSLSLVTDESIRVLNRDYRNKDKPTDVLSFSQLETSPLTPLPSGEGDRRRNRAKPLAVSPFPAREGDRRYASAPASFPTLPLGDVVISVDTALAQARRYAVAPRERLRALMIHGFLHLLGYDHERSRAEARAMFARERELAAMLDAGRTTGRPKPPRRAARSRARRKASR
jgi:rRNA maturation RNase YbeY